MVVGVVARVVVGGGRLFRGEMSEREVVREEDEDAGEDEAEGGERY